MNLGGPGQGPERRGGRGRLLGPQPPLLKKMTRSLSTCSGWWRVATPPSLVRLWIRSAGAARLCSRFGEALRKLRRSPPAPRIWIHAVSVGETRAAAPLVDALVRKAIPGHRILHHPHDAHRRGYSASRSSAIASSARGCRTTRGFAVRSVPPSTSVPSSASCWRPSLWPRSAGGRRSARRIPVVLANARLSERSGKRYARFPAIARWALANLAGIAAQTAADA